MPRGGAAIAHLLEEGVAFQAMTLCSFQPLLICHLSPIFELQHK